MCIRDSPLGEEIKAILDGHIYLSSRLANSQHFPAINILKSQSRVMDALISEEHKATAHQLLKYWSIYEENRDLILLGAYKKGNDVQLDKALEKREELLSLLIQSSKESESLEDTLDKAKLILS